MRLAPRVGFLGVGWIGSARLASLAASRTAHIAAVCDPSPEARARAHEVVPEASLFEHYEELLEVPLDGVVIATPSGLHARQCVAAFERGLAVFCQKPLATSAAEVQRVIGAARASDRLLRVDFCYRHTRALSVARELVASGELGPIHSVELVFHNAYGPEKAWALDPDLAGGGCLMDLGVHLVDAALWVLGSPRVERAVGRRFREGQRLAPHSSTLEDFAVGLLDLDGGVSASLACSWWSSFGDHARIRAEFLGARGGVVVENVAGSFYDFACDRLRNATRERLVSPPDDWGGRALVSWVAELRASPKYRPEPELLEVARSVDLLLGRDPTAASASEPERVDAAGVV
ncbi:MAG: Gfo/Idh/MocA family oxidoreductase [Pseudomonadota bacterium]|nr:MAG: oxidoreductase [Pseudomonadota bacterium]